MKRLLFVSLFAAACGAVPGSEPGGDLPLGDQLPDDAKADGLWGAALTCKPAPDLPSLVAPAITVSLDGLTLHLVDAATGYDQVFPVGVGTIDDQSTSRTFGESLTYDPIVSTGGHDFAIRAADIQPCKTWWTDPETGRKQPVFAGLPFMPWHGAYAVHGPIDNFRAPSGGNLRRGFVSHGCVRMEAADVLEVYARIRRVASTPVHVQREPERASDGRRVDVAVLAIGAECAADADCNFAGGVCKHNRFADRGFCTVRCTATCADRAGYPTTMCVADPGDASSGICVERVLPQNTGCRSLDHFVPRAASRFHQPQVRATVCLPGTPGWIGDHCFADGDCQSGNRCAGANGATPGVCTQGCALACPDEPGAPTTFCASDASLGKTCLRHCTPESNASECPADTDCATRPRASSGQATFACVPRG
ncbi:MAG TPA: L,D-transpeptidase [Polyangia bacterium]|nr:L,D-transpeptidase [Polyangia bacterium]